MHPIPIVVVAAVVILALAAFWAIRAGGSGGGNVDAYYLRKSLFSPAERSFLRVLESLDFEGVVIVSKVRLADVFGVKKGLSGSERQAALNRISAKHVDFLMIHESDGRPLLGIELDDKSHTREDRMERDRFVDALYLSSGLPIGRIVARAGYDLKEVHRQIDEALGSRG